MTSSMVAAASALESDTIRLEKHKLARVQQLERRWLQSALGAELESLRKLEKGSQQAAQEASDDAAGAKADADRRKAESERKREQEHQRALAAQAQLNLEREMARQEFAREQELREKRQLAEAKARKERAAKEKAEADAKTEADREKVRAQERAWQRQKERVLEMERADAERRALMAESKAERQRLVMERQKAKNDRIAKSVENNLGIERKREEDFQNKMASDKERNARLEEERRLFQEQATKRSLQMMLKRQHIADQSDQQAEDKRNSLLMHQEDVENKLMEHEMKKQRYLEFKRELDGLKEKNKQLNVLRNRRRQEFKRESTAEACRQKTMKADLTVLERDDVRGEIMRQKIRSQFDSNS